MENLESDIVKIIKRHYSQILSEMEDIVYDIENVDLKIEVTDNSEGRGFNCKLG